MKQMDYGTGSITKNILYAAGPMIAAQLLSLLYNIVDRIYIGRIPGIGLLALGGIGICFPLISLILAFANLFGGGGAPLCAIASGKGDHDEARADLNSSFYLILVCGLILTGIVLLFLDPILYLFGASSSSILYARPYMAIYLLGTLFSMITLGMNSFISAQGFPGIGMMTIVIGAISNILLDPVLIFTFGMGIEGAAWASVISQGFSAAFVLWFLCGHKAEYRISLSGIRELGNMKRVWEIVSLGFAGFVMKGTNSLVAITANNMLSSYGGDLYISVMTVVSSVRQVLDAPIFGLCDGTGPILSFNYGAQKFDRLKKSIRIMTAVCVIYTLITWALILAVPGFFISVFNSDSTLKQAAVPALEIYFFAFVFQALQNAGQTVFKSLNRKKEAITFSLLRKVIIVIPLMLVLPGLFHLGVTGVFLAEPVSNVIGGTACFATMIVTVYRKLKKQDPEDPAR